MLNKLEPNHNYVGLNVTKPVFHVSDKARLKPVSLALETSQKIEISPVASVDILSNRGITKVPIRLVCAFVVHEPPKTGFYVSRPI